MEVERVGGRPLHRMVSESWQSLSWCWPAVPIQYNTMQYSPSLRRSRSPDTTVLYPLHTSQLRNNAALYEWATVRKNRWDGTEVTDSRFGIQCFIIWGLLLYSCGFPQVCLRIDVSRSANRAPNIHNNMRREELGVKCSIAVVASSQKAAVHT